MDIASVVIIGAGIQGLSVAYHLAKAQVKSITVLEKESIGSGSSGRSASMLMLQRETRPKINLSLFSYRRYLEFSDEIGVDPQFRKIGFLSVVPQMKLDHCLQMAALRNDMGVNTEILSPAQINELVPIVNTDDIITGVYGPDDGVIDARAIMQGYAEAARRLGVSIREGVRAVGIKTLGKKVVAVKSSDGVIHTETVVNAAGADATEVASWVRESIPIINRLRHIFITEPFPAVPDDSPMVEDAAAEWYYRKQGVGVLMGMGKLESGRASTAPDPKYLVSVRQFAAHRVPLLAKAEIVSGWSGLRSLTSDLSPIVGPLDDVDGFINCCGWGGEGVMHAPAGGQMIADLITNCAAPAFDIEQFSLRRFQLK